MKIIFVCTGNTCRSPMAEFLMKKILADQEFVSVAVQSAGIAPATDLEFPIEAREALRDEGIEGVHHQSKPLTQEMVASSQLILAMEQHHLEWIQKRFPEAKKKTYLLNEYVGLGKGGIADPYGQSLATYKKILTQIKQALIRLPDKLKI